MGVGAGAERLLDCTARVGAARGAGARSAGSLDNQPEFQPNPQPAKKPKHKQIDM